MSNPEYHGVEISGPHELRLAPTWLDRFQLAMAFATPILAILLVLGIRYVDAENEQSSLTDLRAARLAACEVANEYNEAVIVTAYKAAATDNGRNPLEADDQAVIDQLSGLNAERDAACRASANATK